MMYEVIISKRAREMLLRHTLFLSYVSLPAAKILRQEFNIVINKLRENPMQFQVEEDLNLPKGKYRRAVFAKRNRIVYSIRETSVYVDSIVDCRSLES